MARFDHVVESSKVGVRKPEPAFYELACTIAGVEPAECVFLDDLGINLKPAKAMGMTTIKVISPEQAIADLEMTLGSSSVPGTLVEGAETVAVTGAWHRSRDTVPGTTVAPVTPRTRVPGTITAGVGSSSLSGWAVARLRCHR